jgi:hypothetical protein
VGIPLVAADLVHGALGEANDVERVKADLRGGGVLADRFLVAAAHVDRDRPDRVLAVAEFIEERRQRGGIAPGLAPHDPAIDRRPRKDGSP